MTKAWGTVTAYILFVALYCYGLFYHISSSEFWPITISKTWYTLEQFEPSMLQKPLFSLFLSLYHLIPLTDIEHLFFVKGVFCFIGIGCLYLTAKIACILADVKFTNFTGTVLILFSLAVSPTLLNNFFRIRSDQLSLFLFLSCCYFLLNSHYKKSMLTAVLTLLTAIKSVIFLPLILLLFFLKLKVNNYFNKISKLYITISLLTILAVLIWVLNFNIPAFYYLLDTFNQTHYPSPWLIHFLKLEFVSLILLFISYIYLYKKNPYFVLISLVSAISFLLIAVIPQNFPFFIAGLAPLLYMPLFVMIAAFYKKKYLRYLYALGVLLLVNIKLNPESVLFSPNDKQFKYIEQLSQFIEHNNLYYLDGIGLFPRQKLVKCFTSPNDASANFACKNKIERALPDIIIHTGRLASELGLDVSGLVNQSYNNELPFIYLKKSGQYTYIEKIKPLLSNGEMIPLLLFQFN